MRNIFLEKPYIKSGEKTSPKPFTIKSKLRISLDQQSEVLYSLFYCMYKWRTIEIYSNQGADHLL